MVRTIIEILVLVAASNKIKRISLATPQLIFPSDFIDNLIRHVFQKNLIPHIPLSGLDNDILDNAKEIGLGKYLSRIERFGKMKFNNVQYDQKNGEWVV